MLVRDTSLTTAGGTKESEGRLIRFQHPFWGGSQNSTTHVGGSQNRDLPQ